jgi:hypothetical protein
VTECHLTTGDEADEALLAKIDAGLAELDQGKRIAHEEGQAAPRVVTQLWSSLQALRDLEAICEYIAVGSPRYADLVVERIIAAVERLRAFPRMSMVALTKQEARQ